MSLGMAVEAARGRPKHEAEFVPPDGPPCAPVPTVLRAVEAANADGLTVMQSLERVATEFEVEEW